MSGLILIVDDDVDCREMLTMVLGWEGFTMMAARNGAEAPDAPRQHHPQLILLDLMMPVMDGYAFRAQQLSEPVIASIPVICISGTHDAQQAARRIGVARCIETPIAFEELICAVRKQLGGSRGRRGHAATAEPLSG